MIKVSQINNIVMKVFLKNEQKLEDCPNFATFKAWDTDEIFQKAIICVAWFSVPGGIDQSKHE